MFCEKCQTNQANIQMNIQFNNEKKQMNLCSSCYNKLKNKMKTPSGVGPFGLSSFDDLYNHFSKANHSKEFPQGGQHMQQGHQHGGGFLDQFGRNLSHAAKAGLIDPVIGRDQEVQRVIEILNRRNKNNPVLIGEPGVGKTAIAEGLALKISEAKVPSKLLNKEVYLLDVASLVADTGIRGQFEERMKQLISELQARKNIILFVDEVHQLVGAGSAQGSMDAGNILKPALARGELQIIGATTLKEYRDIEKDAALERRFQPVIVNEPSVEQAIEILQGIRSKYEDYHHVSYTDEALQACVKLSHRYIQDRFLPDKAIDLLDEAGSKKNLEAGTHDTTEVEARLQQIAAKKERAAKEEDYETAARLRKEELTLEEQLKGDLTKLEATVNVEDIQMIIEQKTGIPVRKLQQDDQLKMKDLDKRLEAKVIGQQEAVNKVTKAIKRSRAGLKNKNRPIGSFLFVGPTGVGKTELTKCLAEELFGEKDSLIRLDMSEYMEKHSVSKIIGSPPGYVGHDEAGQLTEQVRRKPYSIILLDEIEKAHPDVQHMFLQILEDGRLTDSQGKTVNFKDTVIIMTSNAGVSEKKVTVGFENEGNFVKENNILDSLGSFFKPEFLNRFDSIIEFNHLNETHLLEIIELLLNDLKANLNEQNIDIHIDENAKRHLAKLGYHPAFGARPLRRMIQEHIEDQIADYVLNEENVTKLTVKKVDEKLIVEKE